MNANAESVIDFTSEPSCMYWNYKRGITCWNKPYHQLKYREMPKQRQEQNSGEYNNCSLCLDSIKINDSYYTCDEQCNFICCISCYGDKWKLEQLLSMLPAHLKLHFEQSGLDNAKMVEEFPDVMHKLLPLKSN